jgi:hypothetical protein
VQGGAGICHVNGNPNSVSTIESQDVRSECLFAIDTTNQTRLWYYKHDEAQGSRWQLIDLQEVTDTDTRLDNPRVSNDTLLFDVLNVKTSTVTGTQFVLIGAIAPVQSVAAGTGISVNTTTGVATVTNTAPDQTVTIDGSASGISVTGTYPNFTIAPANDLAALEALSGTGFTVRTGSETYAQRVIEATNATIAIVNGNGVSGNPGLALAQQGATTGEVLKWNGTIWAPAADNNSGGTVTSVGIGAPAAGITVSNSPVTGAGTINLSLANDLAAVEGLTGTGIAVRTGADTWATRTLVAGTGISLTNANGTAGDITITNSSPNVNQTLSISGQDLSISAGNTVTLPSGTNIYNSNGTLTGARTVTHGSNQLTFEGGVNGDYLVGASNTGTSGVGIQGTGVTGVLGTSTNGFGVSGRTGTAGTPFLAERLNPNAGVVYGMGLYNNRTTAAANDGSAVYFSGNLSNSTQAFFADQQVVHTNITAGSHAATWNLRLANAGTLGTRMSVTGAGQLTLNSYGAGTFTGTATKWLATTVSGAVIEMDAPSGTTDLTFTGSDSPYTLNSSSGTNVTFSEGPGIKLTRTSNDLEVGLTTVTAKSQADAATAGVSVGGYFYASIDNTMGAAPGSLIRRMY